MSSDNPYTKPDGQTDGAKPETYDRDVWNKLLLKAKKDKKFAVIWSLSWLTGVTLGFIFTEAIILPFFCVIALISGLVGMVKDGKRVKELVLIGKKMQWSQ